ncbi:MAG TPA: hypothetical protein VIM98_13010 [Dyella sp.]|uniref:hypothetical protein n=1 Tax=Dyella sp. TaxID=1869338 RepID=UPI002F94311C
MSIELHIERLVLDEALLGGERAVAVRQAIERELSLRLTRPGVCDALRGIGRTTALPAVTLPAADHAGERLASRVARAVQQGLGVSTSDGACRTGRLSGGGHG